MKSEMILDVPRGADILDYPTPSDGVAIPSSVVKKGIVS
jgi:hypothetical protein